MIFEDQVIRIQPLTSVFDGRNAAQFVNSVLAAGYDRFYVKVPDGFQVDLIAVDPFPPGYQLNWPRASARVGANKVRFQYLQLDRSELRNVIENPPATLGVVRQGGLEVVPDEGELICTSFKYRPGWLGSLLPTSAEVADETPTEFDKRSSTPVVVKALNRNKSAYSYALHGIRLGDIFVEEAATAPMLAELPAESVKTVDSSDDLLWDPYDLRGSSPLVYELLCVAHENWAAPQNRMKESELLSRFEAVNDRYEKNPRPFNSGRAQFASNLVTPGYKYDKAKPDLTPPFPKPCVIPQDDFLDQDFINEGLKQLLYAACCWNDRKEPNLGRDLMKLVDLLRSFGLRDAGPDDPVQRMVYFIAGMSVKRKPPASDYKDVSGSK